MLTPNQTLLLHDYFTRSQDLWLLCEKYDCDHDQMMEIIGAITAYLPGKGLDYNAILSNDPIACDHLVLHCQRSIGQLDALYDRLISLFDSSSSRDLQINKRTTVNTPPDWAKPSFSDGELRWDTSKGSEKVETTTLENKQRFRILDSAMKCLERGLKMQITLTQRKEKLSKQQDSVTQQEPPKQTRQQVSSSRGEEKPTSAFTGLSGYTGLTGYNFLSSPLAPRGDSRATERSPKGPETHSGNPGWSYSTTMAAQPQEASSKTHNNDNNLSQEELREKKPITANHSEPSAPPREPQSAVPKIPHPQYSAPSTEPDSDWQTFIPLGMDNGGENGPMEEFIYPVFSHPYGEKEKIHYFPPFTKAAPDDAEEIDAYLKSLPSEITADKNIGSYLNAYLVAPVIRTTQSEAQHTIEHRRLKREAARQAHHEQTLQLQLATAEANDNNEPSYHQRE